MPSALHELESIRCESLGLFELAFLLARVHYFFGTLQSRPARIRQVRSAAVQHAHPECTGRYSAYKQYSYAHTHAQLVKYEGLQHLTAAAHAYLIHLPELLLYKDPLYPPQLKIMSAPPAVAAHLGLPSAYLGVTSKGQLLRLDAQQGIYTTSIGQPCRPLPHGWCVRMSLRTNKFLVGNSTSAALLTLDTQLSSACITPVTLPAYPPGARVSSVDGLWITWARPRDQLLHILAWDAETCSATVANNHDEAKVHLWGKPLYHNGNRVWRGDTCLECLPPRACITQLPPTQSIVCMSGTPLAFDAFTDAGDWWRVDVKAAHAWVISMPLADLVCTIAPLVEPASASLPS